MNKKKIIIICSAVAAVILTAVIALVVIFAGKDENAKNTLPTATVTVESVSAESGKTVRVPISIKKNSGVMGVGFELDYDDEKLEYLSTDTSGILTTLMGDVDENGKLKLIFLENDNVKEDGTMFTLVFMAKEGAKGKAEVKINESTELVNYDEENIPIKAVNGEVTVK